MKQRIIAVHLLNDFSGSPLVFRQALEALKDKYDIVLYTATPSGGFLTGIEDVINRSIFYRWNSNKFITLFYFLLSQSLLFIRLLFVLNKKDLLYVNTLLPFGASLAGYIKGSKVVYHIHETSLKPQSLRNFLFNVANTTTSRVIFVSRYLAGQYQFTKPAVDIIYNCLPETFVEATTHIQRLNTRIPFTVTMLSSFKDYKGVYHFINLARKMPQMQFVLVLNTAQKEVDSLKLHSAPPDNCTIYPAQKNTAKFYENTHVVVNLSKPQKWIETFGMTLLEAMHCGRPVICPPVGGVLELVTDGIEGFAIDSQKEDWICLALKKLAENQQFYHELSDACYLKSQKFGRPAFEQQLLGVFGTLSSK